MDLLMFTVTVTVIVIVFVIRTVTVTPSPTNALSRSRVIPRTLRSTSRFFRVVEGGRKILNVKSSDRGWVTLHLARAPRISSCASHTILTCLDIKPLQYDVTLSPSLHFFFPFPSFSLYSREGVGKVSRFFLDTLNHFGTEEQNHR
jgi:hypothetical protein